MIGQIFSTLGQTALSLMATGALHVATALTGTAAAVPVELDRMDLVSGPDDGVARISQHQVRTGLTSRGRAFAEKPPAIFSSDSSRGAIPKQGDLGSALAVGFLLVLGAGAAVTLLRGGRREDQSLTPIFVERGQDVVARGRVLSVGTSGDFQVLRGQLRRGQLSLDAFERVLGILEHEGVELQQEVLDLLFEILGRPNIMWLSDDRAVESHDSIFEGLSRFLTRFFDTPLSSKAYTKLQYLVIDHPTEYGMLVVRFLAKLLDARYPRRTVQARASLAVLATAARDDIAQSARGVLSRFAEAEEADDSAGLARMTGELQALGKEDDPSDVD